MDHNEPIMGTPENADRPSSITTLLTAPEKAPQQQSVWNKLKTGVADRDTSILKECKAERGDWPLPSWACVMSFCLGYACVMCSVPGYADSSALQARESPLLRANNDCLPRRMMPSIVVT